MSQPLSGKPMSTYRIPFLWIGLIVLVLHDPASSQLSHPRLMADKAEIVKAREWLKQYGWYRAIFDQHQKDIDRFIRHASIFVSPVKQTYQYKMYLCPKHDVDLLYEEFRPYEHRCPKDTTKVYRGGRFDASWSGWYNRLLATRLVWMGILYQVYEDPKYAEAGKEILMKFADLYLQYPTTNTILGPAHVFFGTLSESFWGVDMAYGYDLLYDYKGFTDEDRTNLKEKLFYPLATITQQFPESASNRQLWYNNVSAAVGFLYGDQKLIDFALKGEYGFNWELGSALPEGGFWPEWSGYHYVTLRGMIYLAEMARHNGLDQLTEIQSAKTDSAWTGVFSENGQHLMVKAIGEKETEIFQAITPRIGGFYKQMVKDPKPLPMVFSRRQTSATRFAHVLQAYDRVPTVTSFEKGNDDKTYIIRGENGTDKIHVDVDGSVYWVLRTREGIPVFFSGFNIREMQSERGGLPTSDFPLSRIECTWSGEKLSVVLPENFSRVRVRAPGVTSLVVNGSVTPVRRDGDDVLIQRRSALAIEIVNLKAKNKGPIERPIPSAGERDDASWINGVMSPVKRIPGGASETFEIVLSVPNNASAVTYAVNVSFGRTMIQQQVRARAPIDVGMILPNSRKDVLWVTLTNRTQDRRTVSAKLAPDKAWMPLGLLSRSTVLGPGEEKRLEFPLRLSGYNSNNQRYPISLQIESDGFKTGIIRDFYAGTASFAKTAPSLDGSWQGWNRNDPITIDNANQICRLLMGNQPWHGAADLSAKIYAMYDAIFLYIGAEVRDDSLVTHWNFPVMSYPWDTDCMEVVLDTRIDAEQGHDPPTPGLFRHLSMAEYRTTDFGPSVWQGGGAGGPLLPKPNLVPGAETYFTRTSSGYAMICRYPLSALSHIVAQPGYKIGFDVAIKDNDGTNYRKNQHTWAGFNQNQSWWDMATIGALIFGPKQ